MAMALPLVGATDRALPGSGASLPSYLGAVVCARHAISIGIFPTGFNPLCCTIDTLAVGTYPACAVSSTGQRNGVSERL